MPFCRTYRNSRSKCWYHGREKEKKKKKDVFEMMIDGLILQSFMSSRRGF
jgi:hypothetical protein